MIGLLVGWVTCQVVGHREVRFVIESTRFGERAMARCARCGATRRCGP